MKKMLLFFVLLLVATTSQAGTLSRGVSIGPGFIAGGSVGSPLDLQNRYQMAVDSKIGIGNRYQSTYTTYNYHKDTYTIYDNGHDTNIDVMANIEKGEVSIITNPSYGVTTAGVSVQ